MEFESQVGDHGHVDEKEDDFGEGGAVVDLPEFEGDEGGREDDGEKFGPAFAKGKAEAFGKSEASVEEGKGAELLEMVIIEDGGALEEMLDEDVAGIDADEVSPAREVCGDVFVEEVESADGDGEKEEGFGKFEGGNDEKATGGRRVGKHKDHFTLRGGAARTGGTKEGLKVTRVIVREGG